MIARLQLIALLLAPISLTLAQADEPTIAQEYQVKAAILYNFSKFIRWQGDAFASAESPIMLCIVNPDPFGEFIDNLVEGRRVGPQQRKLSVRRLSAESGNSMCHMLFIPREHQLPERHGTHTLLVSEDADITEGGAHINIFTVDGQVRFEIDIDSLKSTNISISSKLLNLARITQRKSGL